MRTSLINNKRFWSAALALLVSLSCIFGFLKVVYAQGKEAGDIPTSDKVVQTEVEVNVRYIFEDEKVFMEKRIKAEKGQLLDSGDLPMLPDDMKFIDEFLFYEVKGDGKDEIVRKIEKIEVDDEEAQTDEDKTKSDETTQTEEQNKEDKGTQTELSKDDILKMEKEAKELQELIDRLNDEIKDKDKLSVSQKEIIKYLENEIILLKEQMDRDKENKDVSADMQKEMDKLREKIKELEKKAAETNKALVTANPMTPISPNSGIKTSSCISNQTPVNNNIKGTSEIKSSGTVTKDRDNVETKENEIRYPNKLTPKRSYNNGTEESLPDNSSKAINTNKGVASAPSKARGTVAENKDNGNKDYPIHHGDGQDNLLKAMYSADARQFVTFQTKNGKAFHLIINHDEDSENVLLLTEVSEDDLLNMVEKKEAPKEVVKEEPVKQEEKPVKKEENGNLGTYLLLFIVIAVALGAGYYFKVIKKKEEKELENFEEDEDDFFAEGVDLDEADDVKESEIEEADDK